LNNTTTSSTTPNKSNNKSNFVAASVSPLRASSVLSPSSVDRSIYSKAISVSSPRLVDSQPINDHLVRKTIVRRVEIPETRTVRVPVQVEQLVPSTVEQRVPVRSVVTVPGYETVEERYVEYEEREAVREKEIWVKKLVPERVVERVPVTKTRLIQRPTEVLREVESYTVVEVPTQRKELTGGYRVDSVQGTKLVEVEEIQEYSVHTEPIGQPKIIATRDLGRLPNTRLGRTIGAQIYPADDPQIARIEPDNEFSSTAGIVEALNRPSSPNSFQSSASLRSTGSKLNHTLELRAAGSYRKPPGTSATLSDEVIFGTAAHPGDLKGSLGVELSDTHSRNCDGTGVQVRAVMRGSSAARAGLAQFDVITAVNSKRIETVEDFLAALHEAGSAFNLAVNRDGRRNIAITFVRS
jgi:hypothetical protein